VVSALVYMADAVELFQLNRSELWFKDPGQADMAFRTGLVAELNLLQSDSYND
jgi:hypothetical protein